MAFDSFVVLAAMRTGSNFLEANLNALEGVSCLGEAFNSAFIGYPKDEPIAGIDRAARDADPLALLAAMDALPGLTGFRYFPDHDPRVLDAILDDPRRAKVILTRNPVESYVSLKIAQATGQWKLTNVTRREGARPSFDAEEFAAHVGALDAFAGTVRARLQRTGQTAFHVGYDDLGDVEVTNGLAAWLGVAARLEAPDRKLKRQNPGAVLDKVANPGEMRVALGDVDRFGLGRLPDTEVARGAQLPGHYATSGAGLMFLPVPGGPGPAIRRWMAAVDGVRPRQLLTGFDQRSLRDWRCAHPGHRTFGVLRHPLRRLHAAFCDKIATPQGFRGIRGTLIRDFGMQMPMEGPGEDWTVEAHAEAFACFLRFVRANLRGQTAARTDAIWASQSRVLEGIASQVLPHMLLREETLARDLGHLCAQAGVDDPGVAAAGELDPHHDLLRRIADKPLRALAREAHRADYEAYGFEQ
ncbi:MAG: sulfotransferase family 2 domain-containing protein [Paracoccaceae bacterium]